MEKTILDIFGRPSHQPFAFYDPGSSSVRTSQATLLSDSTPSSVTLPRWGLLCGGALYELPTPGHLTNGHGSSGLLGTPNSHERTHSPRQVDHGIQLANQVALLPTPAAQEPGFKNRTAVTKDGEEPEHGSQRWYDAETGRLMQKGLPQVVALLPTPAVNDMGAGKTPEAWDEWTDKMREAHDSMLHRNDPTGAFTTPPSPDGSTPPDNQPPGQQTIEDA